MHFASWSVTPWRFTQYSLHGQLCTCVFRLTETLNNVDCRRMDKTKCILTARQNRSHNRSHAGLRKPCLPSLSAAIHIYSTCFSENRSRRWACLRRDWWNQQLLFSYCGCRFHIMQVRVKCRRFVRDTNMKMKSTSGRIESNFRFHNDVEFWK